MSDKNRWTAQTPEISEIERERERGRRWVTEQLNYFTWVIRQLTRRIDHPSLSLVACWLNTNKHTRTRMHCNSLSGHNRNLSLYLNRATLYLDLVQWSLSIFSGTWTSNSITSSSLSSLPVKRIHYNGTRVSHFSLNEGFAGLWSLFQPSHADGFLGPVVCPVQVVSHPVHGYALHCVDSWDNHMLLVRRLLLQHTWKHHWLQNLLIRVNQD